LDGKRIKSVYVARGEKNRKERKKEEEEEECAGSSYRLRRIISLTFVRKNKNKKSIFQEKYKLVFFFYIIFSTLDERTLLACAHHLPLNFRFFLLYSSLILGQHQVPRDTGLLRTRAQPASS
jgi:hypothetical protein